MRCVVALSCRTELSLRIAPGSVIDNTWKEKHVSKKVPFAEALSADPVERAIARRVARILNDRNLDRAQRERLVRKAQDDLVAHRRQQATRDALALQAVCARLPAGGVACSVQAVQGRLMVGVLQRRRSFTWVEAGAAEAAANAPVFALPRRPA